MSASWSGSMRGPRVKTPLLLLLLLLLSALTQTVLCQDEDASPVPEVGEEEVQEDGAVPEEGAENTDPEPDPDPEPEPDPDPEPEPEPDPEVEVDPKITTDEDVTVEEPTVEDNGSGENQDTGETENDPNMTNTQEDEGLSLIIILIPVVLVVLIIGMIVCGIFINRRWNKKGRNQELRQEDPYLDGSSTEKVPMPMFEEDVPSVLELEMEELDQWMKKDGETTEDTKHE